MLGQHAKSNGCGGKLACTCPEGSDGSKYTSCAPGKPNALTDGCCDPYTCAGATPATSNPFPISPALGAGETLCGTYTNGCGANIGCGDCTFGGTKPAGFCTAKSGANYSICACTPTTCAANPNATTDGCGNALHCNACGKDDSGNGGLNLSGDNGNIGSMRAGTYMFQWPDRRLRLHQRVTATPPTRASAPRRALASARRTTAAPAANRTVRATVAAAPRAARVPARRRATRVNRAAMATAAARRSLRARRSPTRCRWPIRSVTRSAALTRTSAAATSTATSTAHPSPSRSPASPSSTGPASRRPAAPTTTANAPTRSRAG